MEGKATKDWRFWVFLILSIFWSIRVFWLLIEDQYFSGFSSSMPLNEVGDFLAGSFSPLAFAWLAYGYWMQNKELKNQINEYRNSILFQINKEMRLEKKEHKLSQPLIEIHDYKTPLTRNIFTFIENNKHLNPSEINGGIEDNFPEIKIPLIIKSLNNPLYKLEINNPYNSIGRFYGVDKQQLIKISNIEKNDYIKVEITVDKKHIANFLKSHISLKLSFYDIRGNQNHHQLDIFLMRDHFLFEIPEVEELCL